uniref:Ig-like domain-containing protein n=1 Tax=Chelonoidis abingdonii TaxID=106734 RepID=A0A8C0GEJ0_CHEAB
GVEFGSLQKSLEVGIGQNVTLSCRFTSGSLPINYIFFRGSQNLWPTIWKTDRNPALFNLTISSASDLGEYKCKVVHGISNSTKYSKSLNFTLLDPVSKPVLSTTTSQVRIGQNVTLSCHSENGSSPINYVFFKGRKTMLSKISMQGKAAAVLNVTINSSSDLSDYKCKAENNIPNNTKYSNSLNFTLAGMCLSYVLLIASDELLMISACLCKLGYSCFGVFGGTGKGVTTTKQRENEILVSKAQSLDLHNSPLLKGTERISGLPAKVKNNCTVSAFCFVFFSMYFSSSLSSVAQLCRDSEPLSPKMEPQNNWATADIVSPCCVITKDKILSQTSQIP